MKKTKSLKVCGLMNEADVRLCLELGVKKLGFVTEFPVDVPWNIDADTSARLRKLVPEGVETVIVTAGENEKIIVRAKKVRPDYVQTHLNKPADEARKLVSELSELGIGVIGKYPTNIEDQEKYYGTSDSQLIVQKMCEYGVAEILIDPRSLKNADARKLSADTELVRQVALLSEVPVILAGGITPDNMMEKLRECQADGVDIMNGSEDEPGRKSRDKIVSLLRQFEEYDI